MAEKVKFLHSAKRVGAPRFPLSNALYDRVLEKLPRSVPLQRMNAVQIIGYIGFVGALFAGIVCLFIALVNSFRTVANRKPDVPLFPHWWESPFNILFRPRQLTARGLAARRWHFYGVLGFVFCCAFAVIIGMATGVAHWNPEPPQPIDYGLDIKFKTFHMLFYR